MDDTVPGIAFKCVREWCGYEYEEVKAADGNSYRTVGERCPLIYRLVGIPANVAPHIVDKRPLLPVFVWICPVCGQVTFNSADTEIEAIVGNHQLPTKPKYERRGR